MFAAAEGGMLLRWFGLVGLLLAAAAAHAQTRYVRGDGQPGKGRYTDIWSRQDGRWRCVAAHVSRS